MKQVQIAAALVPRAGSQTKSMHLERVSCLTHLIELLGHQAADNNLANEDF